MPVPVDEFEAGGLGLRMPGLPFRYLPVEERPVAAVVRRVEFDAVACLGLHADGVFVFESDHACRLCERKPVTHTGAYGKRLR